MLSKERLNDLSVILQAEFGQSLPPEEVFEIGQRLVGLFDHLMKFDFKDNNDNDDHEKERLHKII